VIGTGEHGVGIGKKEYLVEELGEGTVEFMRTIKKAVDPLGILNPGKVSLPCISINSRLTFSSCTPTRMPNHELVPDLARPLATSGYFINDSCYNIAIPMIWVRQSIGYTIMYTTT
jgi:hypothetical protein